uniref:CTLH domain-containing protein n=1 Tax=Leersia perrieri TaxID=77586 RepID=A0A0D9X8J9_9ORYZ
MAARSSKRSVRTEYGCLRRFRRRRLLAFLRHSNLPATFDAQKCETRVFLDVRFLQRLVANGRWKDARGYLNSFLPRQDDDDQILSEEADTVLEFITRFDIFDDLAQGKLGGVDAADDLERQIEAIPSAMADDARYTEGPLEVFFHTCVLLIGGKLWLKAAKVVKELVAQIAEFKHLLLLPRCSINPCYTIPFGFGRQPSPAQGLSLKKGVNV